MSNDSVKHHTVPRFYLKGFTDPANLELIYVFRRGEAPFCTGVKGIAYENNFYTYEDETGERKSIEGDLADKIEAPAILVLTKLRSHQSITKTEKKTLARYISVMLTRVPRHRERAEALFPEVIAQFRERLPAELEAFLDAAPPALVSREVLLDEAHSILEEYEPNVPSRFKVGLISDKYASLFANMNWVFFTATTQRGFLTNDNPVFFFEGLGLVGKDGPNDLVEITFPISRNVTLWAAWRSIQGITDLGYVPATELVVREINNRTVSAALRELYYGSNPRWVRALVNKDRSRIKLNRLV